MLEKVGLSTFSFQCLAAIFVTEANKVPACPPLSHLACSPSARVLRCPCRCRVTLNGPGHRESRGRGGWGWPLPQFGSADPPPPEALSQPSRAKQAAGSAQNPAPAPVSAWPAGVPSPMRRSRTKRPEKGDPCGVSRVSTQGCKRPLGEMRLGSNGPPWANLTTQKAPDGLFGRCSRSSVPARRSGSAEAGRPPPPPEPSGEALPAQQRPLLPRRGPGRRPEEEEEERRRQAGGPQTERGSHGLLQVLRRGGLSKSLRAR